MLTQCLLWISAISKLGKKLQLRQRVIATATVFFRRFYLKNAYCDTDPFIVIAACCYVAAKAEESPVHIKNIVAESRALFSRAPSLFLHHRTFDSNLHVMQRKTTMYTTFRPTTPNSPKWSFTSLTT